MIIRVWFQKLQVLTTKVPIFITGKLQFLMAKECHEHVCSVISWIIRTPLIMQF